MTSTIDFRAVSSVGVIIATFADRKLARRWWELLADEYPGCRVVEHTVTTTERTVFRTAPNLRVVARS